MPVDLKEYTDVAARIGLFYAGYPNGRLITKWVKVWTIGADQYVVVRALAKRSPDDTDPGTGHSWMKIPGGTNFTRGSEIENTETSAWGRAIGSLGIGIKGSIATTDEIAGHKSDEPRKHPGLVDGDPPERPDGFGSYIGTVAKGASSPVDMSLRAEPDGRHFTGFALRAGRQRLQVVAVSPLAETLQPFLEGLIDQRVTCYGTAEMVPWRKEGREMPPYVRLQLARIETEDWIMPPREEDAA
jgi:hypothetical protein